MDLNDDGRRDILSGSYSRKERPMAGLFQVLWGRADGSFAEAEPLAGTDGKPLVIPASGNEIIRAICTRPFAVDWDADGDLDILSGNMEGSFYLFTGEGGGRFRPEAEPVEGAAGRLRISAPHSDPFVVDWDGDGDLDVLSGSSWGGVQWSENLAGAGKAPEPGAFKSLVRAPGPPDDVVDLEWRLPDGPKASTRIWVADVNGDGRLDLLVGDTVTLIRAADGLGADEFRKRQAEWNKATQELVTELGEARRGGDEKGSTEIRERLHDHHRARKEFVLEERTGFVWLYLRK